MPEDYCLAWIVLMLHRESNKMPFINMNKFIHPTQSFDQQLSYNPLVVIAPIQTYLRQWLRLTVKKIMS